MSNYVVTFRIANKTLGGRTYQDRYNDLDKELRARAKTDGIWYDTTSFFLVGSSENTYEFGERLSRGLNSEHDMVFTFDPSDMSACYFGNIEAPDVLVHFFPNAIKLG